MELFSEVYGCYYTVVARILEQAGKGLSKAEIERYVTENAFYDSAFHLLPQIFSDKWDLLEEKEGIYYSKVKSESMKRPLTMLEKSWIRTLLRDKRIGLFLSEQEKKAVLEELFDVEPLFQYEDIHEYDIASDGDVYSDENYKRNFNKILNACKNRYTIKVGYESGRGQATVNYYAPYKLCYSGRDDKFRLLAGYISNNDRLHKSTLNLSRITFVEAADLKMPSMIKLQNLFDKAQCEEPIVLKVSKMRNALERCMLQFASWEKQTEYDELTDSYICRIYYDKMDETELVIRMLSFGPAIQVIGPHSFRMQLKSRIQKQFELNRN